MVGCTVDKNKTNRTYTYMLHAGMCTLYVYCIVYVCILMYATCRYVNTLRILHSICLRILYICYSLCLYMPLYYYYLIYTRVQAASTGRYVYALRVLHSICLRILYMLYSMSVYVFLLLLLFYLINVIHSSYASSLTRTLPVWLPVSFLANYASLGPPPPFNLSRCLTCETRRGEVRH